MNRHSLPLVAVVLLSASGAIAAEDDHPFPLGPLAGKAFQTEGTSLLKITEVTPGGPAAAAGLRAGDFLYGVNGERLPVTGARYVDSWRGAVTELGYAIERSESTNGALSLLVLRAGTGPLTLNATLPVTTAWRPSYPVGDPRMSAYFEKVCADLHAKVHASGDGNFGYVTGFLGMILLAHADWNQTAGPRPYRNSINKLRAYCVAHLGGRIVEPVENNLDCQDVGLENWDITAHAMFLGEYRRKTGDTGVNADVQRAALMIANRVQNYPQADNDGVMHQKPGRMGHCGVVGDYPHAGLLGLNIINAHAMLAMGILRGAGANFNAASGASGMTINEKYLLNWTWLKSCTNTTGSNEDGNVGYGGIQDGPFDSAARTAGAAAGYEIYRAAGGTAPNADDLDKLNRMKAYVPRNWQTQQHAHAYTVGGTAFSQMLLPFLSDRSQRYFMDNSRFLLTMSRNHTGEVLYFPGRANSFGDSYLDYNNVGYIMPGLVWAIASGNLPSFPAPATATSRAFVRMNSPRNDWPQLAARRVKVVGLVQNLDLDVTNHLGNVLPSGYTVAWSKLTGAALSFSATNTLDTTVTFSAAGNYRLRLVATVGAYTVTEDYDFEVATSVIPPDDSATITQQPVSRLGVPGGSATFTTAVTGGGPFLYQWKLDGVAYGEPGTSPVLRLENLSPGSFGAWQCTIWHPGGQVTTNPALLCLAGTLTVAPGGLKREVWNNTSGVAVAGLTGSARYPRCPDVTSTVTEAEGPLNYGDNYGQRLSGWVIPPTTGNYTFYVASDDASELWLSTNESPANKVKIAEITGWTTYRNYSAGPSSVVTLTAGQRYYIEALQVEGNGDDHLSIAWRKPGDAVPANGSPPIQGANLESEIFTLGPGLEGLVSWWNMDESAGTLARDAMAAGNDGNLSGPAWTAGRHGGALLFDSQDQIFCSNAGALGGLTPFTVAAWVKVNTGNATEGVILQQRAANGFNGQYQLLVRSTGKPGFWCYGDSNFQFDFSGATSVNDGQWHHIAGVRDAAGGARIYVDGVQDGSVSNTTVRNLDANISVGIGADIRDNVRHFRGSIDDVRVYGCALTPAQLSALAPGGGRWSTATWTNDATAGIPNGSAWAYHFGNAASATIAGQAVNGIAGGNPSVAGRFSVAGVPNVFNNDANNLTPLSGSGSAIVARDFIWGGNPATVTLQGLVAGRSYVVTVLSAGWEAPGGRVVTFASGGDTRLIDQDQYGDNRGLRVDYAFMADAATRVITVTPASANTFHFYGLALRQGTIVTNDCDSGPGSLRQALADAALTSGADIITFDPELSGQIITHTSELSVSDTGGVTVDATALTGGLTLSGGGTHRIFQVAAATTLALTRMNLTSGQTTGAFPDGYGGAIFTRGDMTLTECSISGCSASGAGGAIAILGSPTVRLNRSTLHHNASGHGGAVQNEATLIADTSTFALNTASQAGGAISAPFNRSVNLIHSTVSANTAGVSGGGFEGGGFRIENTIAAGNSAPTGANINGNPVTAGANLTTGSPLLAPVGDYGGLTFTMPPLPGSPAINAATGSTAVIDQRGFARDATPDIGAAEYIAASDLVRYWTEDWDGDGSLNGAELALGTDPLTTDPNSTRNLRIARQPNGRNNLIFGYNAALAGRVRWVLESSSNLTTWNNVFTWDGSPHFFGDTSGGLNGSTFTIDSASQGTRTLYRFEAELLP